MLWKRPNWQKPRTREAKHLVCFDLSGDGVCRFVADACPEGVLAAPKDFRWPDKTFFRGGRWCPSKTTKKRAT